MSNDIAAYWNAIRSGSVTVGKWIRLWYRYVIDGLAEGRFRYSPRRAQDAIRFMESFLHHHEGALAPELVRLELWQRAMLSVIFGVLDTDGYRQFREVIVELGRKNGKTLLAAGIAEYMTYLDDYGARVYFAAPKLDQASLCFDAYCQSIRQEPELSAITRKRRTDIYVAANNATAKPIAFAAKKSDGLNISCVICDEVASWRGNAGLRFYEVHEVFVQCEAEVIAAIQAAPTTATQTAASVSDLEVSAIDVTTLFAAQALLSSRAENLCAVMNRRTYFGQFMSLVGTDGHPIYNIVSDNGAPTYYLNGLRVLFTDALTADTEIVVGDLSAVTVHAPDGLALEFTTDPYSLAERGMVKVVGSLLAGFGVTKDKHLVRVHVKAASGGGTGSSGGSGSEGGGS